MEAITVKQQKEIHDLLIRLRYLTKQYYFFSWELFVHIDTVRVEFKFYREEGGHSYHNTAEQAVNFIKKEVEKWEDKK